MFTFSKDNLINEIYRHPVLHDLITHLLDFKEAVDFKINFGDLSSDDLGYWYKQYNTILRLEHYIKENNS